MIQSIIPAPDLRYGSCFFSFSSLWFPREHPSANGSTIYHLKYRQGNYSPHYRTKFEATHAPFSATHRLSKTCSFNEKTVRITLARLTPLCCALLFGWRFFRFFEHSTFQGVLKQPRRNTIPYGYLVLTFRPLPAQLCTKVSWNYKVDETFLDTAIFSIKK